MKLKDEVEKLTKEANENKHRESFEENGLTRKQNLFVDNYILTENAQKSYMIAYPKSNENTAGVNGHKLLKMEKIQAEIAKRKAEKINSPDIATAEDMFKLLTQMMFDPEVRPSDRMKAIELLGKNQALWVDRVEHTNQTEFVIELGGNKTQQIDYVDMPIEFLEQEEK